LSRSISIPLLAQLSCGPLGRLFEGIVSEHASAREGTILSSTRDQINSDVPEARSATGTVAFGGASLGFAGRRGPLCSDLLLP
jgi:hypothetical protein